MGTRTWQNLANIVTLVFALVMNILATTLPLNGRDTGEISDNFGALFTPAGYVFSIWGLIYAGLIGFTIFQALPKQQNNPRVAATGWWVALSNVANGAWIYFWHYDLIGLTLVAMLTLLVSLAVIYRRVYAPRVAVVDTATRWLVQAPFSLYLGWISVATIANVSIFLIWLGWDGGALAPVLTGLLILVAAGLALFLRDPIFTLVIVWAVAGIIVNQFGVALIVAAGALAIAVCLGWLLSRLVRPMAMSARGGLR